MHTIFHTFKKILDYVIEQDLSQQLAQALLLHANAYLLKNSIFTLTITQTLKLLKCIFSRVSKEQQFNKSKT